jgi:hypothetical protein
MNYMNYKAYFNGYMQKGAFVSNDDLNDLAEYAKNPRVPAKSVPSFEPTRHEEYTSKGVRRQSNVDAELRRQSWRDGTNYIPSGRNNSRGLDKPILKSDINLARMERANYRLANGLTPFAKPPTAAPVAKPPPAAPVAKPPPAAPVAKPPPAAPVADTPAATPAAPENTPEGLFRAEAARITAITDPAERQKAALQYMRDNKAMLNHLGNQGRGKFHGNRMGQEIDALQRRPAQEKARREANEREAKKKLASQSSEAATLVGRTPRGDIASIPQGPVHSSITTRPELNGSNQPTGDITATHRYTPTVGAHTRTADQQREDNWRRITTQGAEAKAKLTPPPRPVSRDFEQYGKDMAEADRVGKLSGKDYLAASINPSRPKR